MLPAKNVSFSYLKVFVTLKSYIPMVFLLMCFGVHFYILGKITGLAGVCVCVHVCVGITYKQLLPYIGVEKIYYNN